MKKTAIPSVILISILIFMSAFNIITNNGFRKLRPDEITYLNKSHQQLYDAVPHAYKDWKTLEDSKQFDVRKYWCQEPTADYDCTGDCPSSVGVGDPYSMDWKVDFSMPRDQSDKLAGESIKMIKDFSDPGQIAASLKFTNKSKLQIFVISNVVADVPWKFSYCNKTPPVTIELPVQATLAVKGIKSTQCPIVNENTTTANMSADYYDRAIIFLGKPLLKKETTKWHDGLDGISYYIDFDKSKIGKLITQNIVVQIIGDSADIDAAIKLIDWQKLNDMIEK